MRVLVCDDDPMIRYAVAAVIRQLDGEVVAETDQPNEATAMIERYSPDVVVLDLGLNHGTGVDVLDQLEGTDQRPEVVVFTAFDGTTGLEDRCAGVVHKPDFDALERRLVAAEHKQTGDRRRKARKVPKSGAAIDDSHDFYRMLADAMPGDTLATVAGGVDAVATVEAVRRCVRDHDRVLLRGGNVLALLIGGGPTAVAALHGRLVSDGIAADVEVRGVVVDDDPTAAFDALTQPTDTTAGV